MAARAMYFESVANIPWHRDTKYTSKQNGWFYASRPTAQLSKGNTKAIQRRNRFARLPDFAKNIGQSAVKWTKEHRVIDRTIQQFNMRYMLNLGWIFIPWDEYLCQAQHIKYSVVEHGAFSQLVWHTKYCHNRLKSTLTPHQEYMARQNCFEFTSATRNLEQNCVKLTY